MSTVVRTIGRTQTPVVVGRNAEWVIRDRPIRFALVGCGRIAHKHIEAFRAHGEHAELAAVCDNTPGALQLAEQQTGATAYDRYEELLRDPSIDVVVLATPSGMHAEQGILAAQAGKHVITEKPM